MSGPRWKPEEDRELDLWWSSGLRLDAIANRFPGRTKGAVYRRAKDRGLGLGCPKGFEYLHAAAERTGYCIPTLRRILDYSDVQVHVSLRMPGSTNKNWRRHYVDPFEVDEAIALWMKTEKPTDAARRRGVNRETLRRWLRKAGALEMSDGTKIHRRVASDIIERVVAEHTENPNAGW